MDDTADEDLEGDETGSQERAASGAPKSGWAVPNRFTASDIFERVLASEASEGSAERTLCRRPKGAASREARTE